MADQKFYREAKFQLGFLNDRNYASTAGEDDEIAMARASQVPKELEIFEKGWATSQRIPVHVR